MRKPARLPLLSLLSVISTGANADSFNVSGGLDTRVEAETRNGRSQGGLDGAFVNVRNVWSDDEGDRWISVAQLDVNDNLKEIEPYQLYLQYKGPLGKWNLRAGHFLLPFGLLANYDTERLLLGGLEPLSLGIRKDTGGEVLGHYGDIDQPFHRVRTLPRDWPLAL